jgi:hypothetical protein
VNIRGECCRRGGGQTGDNGVHAIPALVDGVLDEGKPAQFPDDEHILDTGLVF